ncbi:MAG: oxidoreductase [Spirochaetes bacterium GWD1_61_31]|nr:MAG: oxidoreductase [Spirochaetes bacterium GWB1_60_80]OHD28924.1 MAG: oxidoreductase [Spirochaetes bacterium GWC1_61_12]OHD39112.1 MAG: oxidoreductase [Spirochaetes bacterium GWD1_61_31]OHD43541.1 MAG: oxidoreductase [Spirochaetes bacterium GWE1_60_18]OHD59008.1 MAG: oxidoreductase [Spirochaetes bacterium GWF1_60_12]HAP44506.1 FAD-binding oxidoreductase [Spirochaetaceae bacterium]
MAHKDEFYPDWFEAAVPADSFRSIFKWGDPREYKHPNRKLYRLMRQTFKLGDDWFRQPRHLGLEAVPADLPCALDAVHVAALRTIVGPQNAHTDAYNRARVAYGKTMLDLMRLRYGVTENFPDMVLWPRNRVDLRAIVDYCEAHAIPVNIYGGGSSVSRGVEAVKGGVSLDMRVHLKRVLAFDERNQTITVEAGMSGPELERILRDAPNVLQAKRPYTVGHLPQSFEYSVVGGWVVTRGAGQNSTYYGKIEDMVICQDYVCPGGRDLATRDFPAAANGPDVDQLMMGSEGTFGILYSATLKLRKYLPQNTRRFSFIFPDWERAKDAAREIMQGEFGFPSVFRLSDPEETDVALKLYGVDGTILDTLISLRGMKKGERCLMLGTADGEAGFSRHVKRMVKKICARHGAMYTTGLVQKSWEHGRFRDPYMREDLQDYGIMIDTLECTVNWTNLEEVHTGVRAFCHSRPDTICMTHMSHFYPQGCNLYFIFIAKMEKLDEYVAYQRGILDSIQRYGATMSHHHGIGKSFAPWLEGDVGPEVMKLFKTLKRHFDPKGVMNPGGTLGLDLPDSEKRFMKK